MCPEPSVRLSSLPIRLLPDFRLELYADIPQWGFRMILQEHLHSLTANIHLIIAFVYLVAVLKQYLATRVVGVDDVHKLHWNVS